MRPLTVVIPRQKGLMATRGLQVKASNGHRGGGRQGTKNRMTPKRPPGPQPKNTVYGDFVGPNGPLGLFLWEQRALRA